MKTIGQTAPGMTMIEVVISVALFAILSLVAFTALDSARRFTDTNESQVELQESARKAIEKISEQVRSAGRMTQGVGPTLKTYPKLYKSNASFPSGYASANNHPPKHAPKAKPGTKINGGDPTLPSDECIFKLPLRAPGGLPVVSGTTVTWTAEEYGFFVVPGPDGINQLEFRNSSIPGQGQILARNVDRLQIHDFSTDPALSARQLRITLYLTKSIAAQGILSNDAKYAQSLLTVSLSTVVDMRNTSWSTF